MKRFDIIDGMRGYFLVFMLLNHLVFVGGFWLVEVNHRQFAFVEDAQGFVFLSGLLIGLVYAKKMMKGGWEVGRDKILGRAFELYRYALGLIIAALLVRMLLPGGYQAWWNWLGDTTLTDPKRMMAVATFVFQPTFMDILPQYIIYMLFSPLLIWLCLKGKWPHVLIGSFIIWLAGQLGLHRLVTEPLNMLAMGPDEQGVRVSFNLLGWQLVFFTALVAGVLTATKQIDWKAIFSPERTVFVKASVAICLFFVPLRFLTANGLLPGFVMERFGSMEVRADFGLVYLVNFLAVGYLVAWLIIAGPKHENAAVRRIADAVHWVFTLRFLQLLGRHSLQVYVWHVAIVYLVYYIDARTPELSQVTKTIIGVVAIASLALPALWRERDKWIGTAPAAQSAG